MSGDLHLSLHKGDLGVQLAEAHLLEVAVSHSESSIGLRGLASLAESLSVLEVNLVNQGWLGTLLCGNLESEDGVNLRDKGLSMASLEVSCHHVEDAL